MHVYFWVPDARTAMKPRTHRDKEGNISVRIDDPERDVVVEFSGDPAELIAVAERIISAARTAEQER
jgi:hypothetical protein